MALPLAKCEVSADPLAWPRWWWPGAVVSTLLLSFALGPFAALLWQAAGEVSLAWLWQDAYLLRVLRFSLWQALLSSGLSVLLALLLARALARRCFWGRAWLVRLLGLSWVLPVIMGVFGVVTVYGQQGWLAQLLAPWARLPRLYGLTGILLVHLFFNVPWATRLFLDTLARIPVSQWRLADQLGFHTRALWWRLEWPVLKAPVRQGAALIFVLCMSSFTAVLALGGGPAATTLEVAIYQALKMDFDLGLAASLALCHWLVCLTGLWLAHGGVRAASDSGAQGGSELHCAGNTAARLARPDRRARYWRLLDSLLLLSFVALWCPVLLAMLLRGFNPQWAAAVMAPALWVALAQSLAIALPAGALACALALALLLSVRHLRLRLGHPHWAARWEASASVVLALPAMVQSTGLFLLLLPLLDLFRWGAGLIVLLNALLALPFVLRVLSGPLQAVAARYDRLALSLGLRGLVRAYWLEWPLLRGALALALSQAMLLSLGDMSAIALLGNERLTTLPWLLYQQLGSYQIDQAAVTAQCLLLLCVGLFWLCERRVGTPAPNELKEVAC
ncbi:MAG: thiamine/thiamine pyrophosphate ABC transporter permease [Aeromonas sp.]